VPTTGDVLTRTHLARRADPLEDQRRSGPEALGPQ